MGKRSEFERRPRDYYPTPLKAVEPLVDLWEGAAVTFCEPCAGDGRLVGHLEALFPMSLCVLACDVEPQISWVLQKDATTMTGADLENAEYIITNPPFTWGLLKPLLDVWIPLRPTLLLLPADFMHNRRLKPYMDKCVWIKSVGRVKWIEGSTMSGVDNFAWMMFDNNKDVGQPTHFYGRN